MLSCFRVSRIRLNVAGALKYGGEFWGGCVPHMPVAFVPGCEYWGLRGSVKITVVGFVSAVVVCPQAACEEQSISNILEDSCRPVVLH